MSDQPALLEVEDLHVTFPAKRRTVQAVRGISFSIRRGERVGMVGESGSGKTITAHAIADLLPRSAQISGGLRLEGQELTRLSRRQRRELCGTKIGMIFQDPLSALNPAMSVGNQIAETMRVRQGLSRTAARGRAVTMLAEVGIPRAERNFDEYPHRFSGGMRQRVMIAIALSCRPALIIADEPTTALDVTIQAQILELLANLCREYDATLLLITHDLGVLAGLADRIVVTYAGRVLEQGPVDSVYHDAAHPYTWAMLGSISRLDRPREGLRPIPGEPPSAVTPPGGCPFHPRCPHAVAVCGAERPRLRAAGGSDHLSACHFSGQLARPIQLTGAVR
jgi:oligopeptide/dipeptide ABC transporter ATP-binding protein